MAEREGVLRLEVLDVYSERVKEKVDISLRHQVLTDNRMVRGADGSKRLQIKDLYAVPQGLYRLEIDSLGYQPVSQFVNVSAAPGTNLAVTLPVNPKKVQRVEWCDYPQLDASAKAVLEASSNVLGYEGRKGDELYAALDDIRKAGFLNIITKTSKTKLANGTLVLSYIRHLNELRGDRFFAAVSKELRENTKNSIAAGLFEEASELLHRPPDGFTDAGSFKSLDRYGNLQLSFFSNGTDWVADIDIDDARGLEHIFQVLRNFVENRPTHPYDIHEILIYHQKIDPGYRLFV
jgi:hypothetical protein